ncbi:hypothetical protein [Sulfuricurvum sp.]|uniref:hypothetical protein n=1 Tax=Sulfuricurvum sp. TaxID=2025608 RepID=UPI00260A0106|nr:hypothetical protein [Sulfuricurvum sp.]MDD2267663.1 hypothetical protein [Sulfuricurvum sp.]MDD2784248.1 hypothetical protein [Sulfuricurvum sp.]
MSELQSTATMTPEQKKAMDVWLESATLDNDFETISDRRLSEVLMSEHSIEASKSAIERWRKKFNWESFLDLKIASSIVTDEEKMDDIKKSVGIEVAKAMVVDVKRNGELNSIAYAIMEGELKAIYQKLQDSKRITADEAKYAKDVATLTSGREDRLMDRAALMGAGSKVSRDDFLNAIANTIVQLEDEVMEAEFE